MLFHRVKICFHCIFMVDCAFNWYKIFLFPLITKGNLFPSVVLLVIFIFFESPELFHIFPASPSAPDLNSEPSPGTLLLPCGEQYSVAHTAAIVHCTCERGWVRVGKGWHSGGPREAPRVQNWGDHCQWLQSQAGLAWCWECVLSWILHSREPHLPPQSPCPANRIYCSPGGPFSDIDRLPITHSGSFKSVISELAPWRGTTSFP